MDKIAKEFCRLLIVDYYKQFNDLLQRCSPLQQEIDAILKLVQFYINNIGDQEDVLKAEKNDLLFYTSLNDNAY